MEGRQMDSYARFQARSGLLILGVYAGFVVWMTDGLTLGNHSPQALFLIMVGAFVAGAMLFGGLWVAHMRRDGDRHQPDEREAAIEAQAERQAARVTDAGLFVMVLLALSDAQWGWMGSFALTRTEGLIFALFTLSALAGLARFAAGALRARQS
jgi:hypothetical protein